jgi:hypothetical protein
MLTGDKAIVFWLIVKALLSNFQKPWLTREDKLTDNVLPISAAKSGSTVCHLCFVKALPSHPNLGPFCYTTSSICREALLKGENAQCSRALGQLETELNGSKLAATQTAQQIGLLEAALAKEQARRKTEAERYAELSASLQA